MAQYSIKVKFDHSLSTETMFWIGGGESSCPVDAMILQCIQMEPYSILLFYAILSIWNCATWGGNACFKSLGLLSQPKCQLWENLPQVVVCRL